MPVRITRYLTPGIFIKVWLFIWVRIFLILTPTQLKEMITYLKNTARALLALPKKAKLDYDTKPNDDTQLKYENYYVSIDELPLYLWVKCTDGDKTVLRKNGIGTEDDDLEAWDLIYNDYIKLYGLGKLNLKYLTALKKRALAELDYVITGDRFKLTLAEMEERQLETMLNNVGQNITVEQSLIHLSKWVGQWLNAKKLTAREYFDLIGEFEKFAKYDNKIN